MSCVLDKTYLLFFWALFINVLKNENFCECSRILGVFPFSAKSHYMMYEPLLLELAKRGHNVTSINAFPQKQKIPNFTDITTVGYVPKLVEDLDFHKYNNLPRTIFVKLRFIAQGLNDTVKIYDVPDVIHILHSNETSPFDLVIIELFNNDLHLGLAEKLRCPFLSISPCALMPWANPRLANPDNPSYVPHTLSEFSTRMDFSQRFLNTVTLIVSKLVYQYGYEQVSQQMAHKTFPGQDPLWQLAKRTSLILVNTHLSLHGARPLVPGVVEVGGIHVKPANSLPQELQSFIDGAEHGVIYFCMGSMLKATTIPDDKRDALVKVFSRLPQRVLWKWEDDTMPGKSDNVKIVKWMPQRDILEHPNVKLFISHGGLLGTTEAVHCGVPIIGIPFYGDQAGNIEAVASHGAGLRLDYNDINEHNLYDKITQILNNPQYAENAKELSKRFRDRPQSPLETAVYWTEYVIRHKGAPHLRSAAVDLTWYQYLLLDVIAFLLLVAVTVSLLFYFTLKFLIKRLFAKSAPTNKAANKKVKKS
nr:UDP-glucuronosyltransferase [Nilaparvata lugens]